MGNEEDIAGVYEDFLDKQGDMYLIGRLQKLLEAVGKSTSPKLEDYERERLIRIIQNIDWTGKLDCGFEDLRKSISTNDSCG